VAAVGRFFSGFHALDKGGAGPTISALCCGAAVIDADVGLRTAAPALCHYHHTNRSFTLGEKGGTWASIACEKL
jgi:hypothetical protein